MSTHTTNTSALSSGFFDGLRRTFAAIGRAFTVHLEHEARTKQIAQLNAKSDAELKQMGLTRDQIPAYVFRDLFYS